MTLFIEIFLLAIALGLLVPIAVLLVECISAFLPDHQPRQDTKRPSLAVLIPAHNEAFVIGETLKTLLPQLTAQDQLLVVADNCDDATAAIARASGATVIEREEHDRRGKGYALDYGLRFLSANPPEVVVMIDADCRVHPHAIERVACLASATQRPAQAVYLMERPVHSQPKDAISVLAFTVKNLVRPKGLHFLQLPCLLTGTGMAFPWSVIHNVSLASGNIVEDMNLSLELALTGHVPMFCPEARVTGILPQQQQAAKSQRTRWEHGHLQTLINWVPKLLKAAIQQKKWSLLAIALDVSVPPLSMLVILWLLTTLASLLASSFGIVPPILFSLLGLEGGLILISVLGSWAMFCRTDLPISTLLAVPFYVLWKLPLYLAFLLKPQTRWIRTERDIIEFPKP
jgi:cellulose synthase/poly-beta-1,6-N-acetylglucosamine synthase-like glycosyltransferase